MCFPACHMGKRSSMPLTPPRDVLVFSANANASPQVMREVERAVAKGLPVIPFRIEDIPPSKSMEYFISAPHWLDALTPPLEGHLQTLSDSIHALLAAGQALLAPRLRWRPPRASNRLRRPGERFRSRARAQRAAMDHRRDCGRGAGGAGRRVVARVLRHAGPDLHPARAAHRRRRGFAGCCLSPATSVPGDAASRSDVTPSGGWSGQSRPVTCTHGAPCVSDRRDSCASGRADGCPSGGRRQRHLGGQRKSGRPGSADRP